VIKHILFPFDFSPQGFQVAPFVRALALRYGAKVTLLSVVAPASESLADDMPALAGDSPTEWKLSLKAHLDRALPTELHGVAVERVADAGDASIRIAAFAESGGVDLIMMPSRGHGRFRTFLVGSVTAKVLHDAMCPVWTAAHTETQRPPGLPRTILCAVDGSDHTQAILRWAAAFSTQVGGTLKLLHVVGPVTDWLSIASERALQEQVRQEARSRIESLQQTASVDAPLRVVVGEVVRTVSSEASEEDADLLVIGRGVVSEAFGRLRTHAFGLIQRSPCPVLSV
jgi:nucleotide-binding universal stress UspA family protein